jgi:hypothetical protein
MGGRWTWRRNMMQSSYRIQLANYPVGASYPAHGGVTVEYNK